MVITQKQKPMKKFTSILLIAVSIFFLASCEKEKGTTPGGGGDTPNQEEFVKCKINGADFLSNDDSRYHHYIANTAGGNKWLNLRGSNIDVDGITFLFWDFVGVGEYDIAKMADSCAIHYTEGNPPTVTYECNQTNASAGQTSGKIKVTVHNDTQVEGTFEFSATNNANPDDKITITEGSFRITR